MICPNCGSNVRDGSFRCPACHAELDKTMVIPKLRGLWCSGCGALLPPGATSCPNCGLPVEGPRSSRPVVGMRPLEADDALDEAEEEALDSEQTNVIPRIESAIPSEPDKGEAQEPQSPAPSTKMFSTALMGALVVVSAAVLYITHPWNPTAYDTKATTEADTSMAGFPGQITELKGQDSVGEKSEVKSGDQVTLEKLQAVHAELGELAKRVDANEETFWKVWDSSDMAAREAGRDEAQQLSLDISNTIAELGQVDTSSSTYLDEIAQLSDLGNWLRNRMDAYYNAWQTDVQFDDPTDAEDAILAPLGGTTDGSVPNGYKSLFEQNFDAYTPTEKSSSE